MQYFAKIKNLSNMITSDVFVQLICKTKTSCRENCRTSYLIRRRSPYNKGTLYPILCQKITKFNSWYFFMNYLNSKS